jgi:CheY-like chemotaxis protein
MGKTILLVDDEQATVRLLEMNLVRAGYEVLKAYDGVQALEVVRQTPPDLMFLDVTMPRMDGAEVLRTMKSDPELKEIPVIMFTANREQEDMDQALRDGAEYFVAKPVNPVELMGMIKRFFEDRGDFDDWEQLPGT